MVSANDTTSIQKAIDSIPESGGTVFVKAGIHELDHGIHIDHSNIALIGEKGSVLKLGDNVNQPAILVGTDEQNPVRRIENIKISDIEIDGNKDKQPEETDPTRKWLYNNGIHVRMAEDIWIMNVEIHDARSGGIVLTDSTRHVFIDNVLLYRNYWDGIAMYISKDIHVSNFIAKENEAAGLSLDMKLSNIIFSNGLIADNKKVGIFARDSRDIKFSNIVISGNKEDGCFLSHNVEIRESGVTRMYFSNCSFLDNERHGLWLASPKTQSPGTVIIGCLFSGNAQEPLNVHPEGELFQNGNIFQ